MKIAVLTWFRDMNYGTVLQALALQEYLKGLGHTPVIINYLPPRNATLENRLTIFQRLNRKIDYICTNKYKKKNSNLFLCKTKKFYQTIDQRCIVSHKIETSEEFIEVGSKYDAYICGSDQIWNPYWIDAHFFLDFVAAGKLKIAYAPSVGVHKLQPQFFQRYKELLSDFDGLSVREADMAIQLSKVMGKVIQNVCDPIFLIDREQWIHLSGEEKLVEKPYIFYYLLSYNKNHWKAIKQFAKDKRLNIVGIPLVGREFYVFDGDRRVDASPLEFVNYIHNAEYIFTDSFHATAFSILLKKQFYTFERFRENDAYSQNSRVKNLLTKLGLMNRIMKYGTNRIKKQPDINYADQKEKLNTFILDSIQYLDKWFKVGK